MNSIHRFQAWLEEHYKKDFQDIEQSNEERVAKNEVAVFAKTWARGFFFAVTLVAFLAILKWSEPPRDIKPILAEKNVIFLPDAIVCFGVDCLKNTKLHHSVKLPFFDLSTFKDYQDHDIYYRIEANLTDAQIQGGYDTFFHYTVWGDADFYRDGKLVQRGIDIKPIIPVFNRHHTFEFKVTSRSGSQIGMRGITAPFLTDRVTARDLERQINGESHQLKTAFVAQLAALCLLLIMYLTFPYRPELFAFIILFFLEILRLNLYLNKSQTFVSPQVDRVLSHALFAGVSFSLLFFVAMFFRYPLDRLKQWLNQYTLPVVGAVAALDIAITSSVSQIDTSSAFSIALLSVCWALSVAMSFYPLIFLYQTGKVARFVLGCLTLVGITYWSWMNILDYSTLTIKLAYHQTYDLHFFFWMASILGIEIGRTEVRIKQALSLLPREVAAAIQNKEMKWRSGYVILLDVVGWSKILGQLNEDESFAFMQKINEYLLRAFDEPGISICKGTGDGFYLTFECQPSHEILGRWEMACERLAQKRPSMGEIGFVHEGVVQDQVIVRSAIGYGTYYYGIAQVKNLKKEFVASRVMLELAQAMGHSADPQGAIVAQSARPTQSTEYISKTASIS